VSVLCLSCPVQLNYTNKGQLCNLCERRFIAWVAQLPKSKARLTRSEWVDGGSPHVDRTEDYRRLSGGKRFGVR
jgi:hypothetical protein